MIKDFYGDKVAKRSGIPLINHINEGCVILNKLQAKPEVVEAFRLHPIFQEDESLLHNQYRIKSINPVVMALVMEYRNIANQSLSNIVSMQPDFSHRDNPLKPTLIRPIVLSPLAEVNQMLVADKVQNRKDFLEYHWDTHPRSIELEYYFNAWLFYLDVTDDYNYLVEGL